VATGDIRRCDWAEGADALMRRYHDDEWGVAVHDDRVLFEFLTLEGAQAGLSWSTILHRRDGYRRAFAEWDPAAVARFEAHDIERLLQDPSIIRNRRKIESTVSNARAVGEVIESEGSLDAFVWSLVGGEQRRNRFRRLADIPAESEDSRIMSKELKRRGFRFVGPTICYAFMQATGLVDDHVVDCFRSAKLDSRVSTARGNRPRSVDGRDLI
jgi:DNA-3-methyladenine glycosylase I